MSVFPGDKEETGEKMKMKKGKYKRDKLVKEILNHMLTLELVGLAATLVMTILILGFLYVSVQSFQQKNIMLLQHIGNIRYCNVMIQNINYKRMLCGDEEKGNDYQQQVNGMDMELQEQLKQMKTDLPQAKEIVEDIQKLLQQALTYRSQALLLSATDKNTEAVELLENSYLPVIEQVNDRLEELSLIADERVGESLAVIRRSIFLFGIVGAGFILLLSVYITVKQKKTICLITKPLESVEQAMEQMAEGNLDFELEYHRRDEFGHLTENLIFTGNRLKGYVEDISRVLDRMAEKDFTVTAGADYQGMFAPIGNSMGHIVASMENVIGSIQNASQDVQESSEDLNRIAGRLYKSAQKEKEHARLVERRMDELLSATRENLSEAENMNQVSAESDVLIKDGHIAVRGLAGVIGHVEGTFAQITDILTLIQEISEQIKLLTLNASIEAARAGEHGRGFAVLANQMRILVEKTQEATGKTENLIADGGVVIQEGQQIAEDVLQKFLTITEIEDNLVQKAKKVRVLSQQQEEVLHQVYDVTEEMVQMALGYDQVSGEIKQQGEFVSHLVGNLNAEMQKFQIHKKNTFHFDNPVL